MSERISIPQILWGIASLGLVVWGVFFLADFTDRMVAILLGLHCSNRSDIAGLRARIGQ